MRALLSVANRDGIVGPRPRPARPRRRGLRHRRHPRAPRRRRRRGRLRLGPDRRCRRSIGGQVKTFHPAIYAGILARRDVAAQMDELGEPGHRPDRHRRRQRRPVRAGGRRPARRHRRGDRDDRRRRRGAPRRGRPQRAPAWPRSAARSTTPSSSPSSEAPPRRQRRAPGQARRRGVRDVAAYYAEIAAYLNQISNTTFPNRLARRPREGRRPALRREPPPAGGVLPRDDPPQRDPRRRDPDPRRAAVVQQLPRPRHAPTGSRRDFTAPTVAIVKHTDPVGVASGGRARRGLPARARDRRGRGVRRDRRRQPRARRSDRPGDRGELRTRRSSRPAYSQAALGILKAKAGLEILAVPPDPTEGMRDYGIANLDFKRVAGGLLVESLDEVGLDRGRLQVVTRRRPTLDELNDLLFAWRAVCHVRSNAIVLARNGATVGIGAAQASRQVSVEIALRRAGDRAKTAVMASDAYFPFPDGIQMAAPGRGHGDHPAGRLDPRRDGDRGRRPPPPGDGLHGDAALPALMGRPARQLDGSSRSDGTAARARDGPRHRGRGAGVRPLHGPRREGRGRPGRRRGDAPDDGRDRVRRHGSSSARASATRRRCSGSASRSGGGRRQESTTTPRSTSPSTRSRARTSSPTARPARSRSSPRPRRAAWSTPRTRTSRSSASGPSPPARSTSACRPTREPRAGSPTALGRSVGDITVVILERPRHEALIDEVRAAGARIKLISDGDLSAAITLRRPGHRRPRRHGHRRRARGRPHRGRAALPRRRDPGPLPLPQRRGAGPRRGDGPRRRGARLHDRGPRLGRERSSSRRPASPPATCSRASASSAAAPGPTRSSMAYQTKQVRFVDTVHMFDRDRPPSVRL